MVKLDLKDRKIIYHLNLDSRQSYRLIGRKVGLSKDAVVSRVKKLQEKKILKKFITHIDEYKLGYTHIRFYLNYQYPNPAIKKKIIEYFMNFKYCRHVCSCKGEYEFILIMAVKNIQEFYKSWELVLNEYREYFSNYEFSIYFQEKRYKYSFLLEEDKNWVDKRLKYTLFGNSDIINIDNLDLEILKLLSINARLKSIDIASKLNSSASVVSSRIKKLIENDIIKGFTIELDFARFEYKQYKANLLLKKHKKLNDIINFIEKNPNLVAIYKTIGYVDIELVFNVRNIEEFFKIMEELTEKFPDIIKSYTYMSDLDTHKFEYFH